MLLCLLSVLKRHTYLRVDYQTLLYISFVRDVTQPCILCYAITAIERLPLGVIKCTFTACHCFKSFCQNKRYLTKASAAELNR